METAHFFLYRTVPHKKPVGCLALAGPDESAVFAVAVSLCAPTDEWNRRTAVDKARGRLRSNPQPGQPPQCVLVDTAETVGIEAVLRELGLLSAVRKAGLDMEHAEKTLEHQLEFMLKRAIEAKFASPGCP